MRAAILSISIAATLIGPIQAAAGGGDPACNANPAAYVIDPVGSAPPIGLRAPFSYRFLTQVTSPAMVSFHDSCPTGDTSWEMGLGAAAISAVRYAGHEIHVAKPDGTPQSFIVASDRDGTSTIGDSPFDCVEGPFHGQARPNCAPGHFGMLLVFPINRDLIPLDVVPPAERVILWSCPSGDACALPEDT